jgi:uncharacterized membrane protein
MDKNLKRASIIVATIGLLDATYLSWVKLSNNEAACLPGLGDCSTVNLSRYSEIFGIPIAILGAGAFIIILSALLFESRTTITSELSKFLVFGISLIGTLYSAYLTYIEIGVIRAICPYCVISAISMTVLLGCSIVRLKRQTPIEP